MSAPRTLRIGDKVRIVRAPEPHQKPFAGQVGTFAVRGGAPARFDVFIAFNDEQTEAFGFHRHQVRALPRRKKEPTR